MPIVANRPGALAFAGGSAGVGAGSRPPRLGSRTRALATLFAHPLNHNIGPQRLVQAHRRIIEALTARSRETAELWMRRHILDFRRGYELCGFNLREVVGYDLGSARGSDGARSPKR